MTFFYIGAAVLILFGAVFALWPLIKNKARSKRFIEGVDRKDINIALYQDHLSDIEQSLAQGNISQSQFDVLKQELERNLLEDSQQDVSSEQVPAQHEGEKEGRSFSSLFYVALVLVLLPITVLGFYQWLGNAPGWQLQSLLKQQAELEAQFAQAPASKTLEEQLTQFNLKLVAELDEYVKRKPEDIDTRVLLARNAVTIGDYDKAIETYQQVLEKEPQSSQMIAELAQVIFVKANNRAVPVVSALAERALSIQPNNVMALGLMGVVAFQGADYQKAVDYWEKAVGLYPPGSPNGRALQSGIVQAKARLAAEQKSVDGSQASSTEQAGAAVIKVAVSLGDNVPFKPEDTVFVYARAWQGAKVPLAITRLKASQLPLTLELNDAMSMAPGMNLSSVAQVEVVARLSPSGNAIAQADDWQVSIGPLDPKTASTTVYPLVVSTPHKVN